MRRFLFLILWLGLIIPGLLRSETLYLKDGSVFRGTVVRLENDTLSFKMSIGSVIEVPKSSVMRIDFVDVPFAPGQGTMQHERVSTEPGTLLVAFEDFEVTSKIIMKRGLDRESFERENSIEQELRVSDRKVHSVIDSTTDKVIKKGPETVLRNNMKPRDFSVALPSGLHHCVVLFTNSRVEEYGDNFDPKPLKRKLDIENVQIEPGETFVVRIGVKRKKWGVSKTVLYRMN